MTLSLTPANAAESPTGRSGITVYYQTRDTQITIPDSDTPITVSSLSLPAGTFLLNSKLNVYWTLGDTSCQLNATVNGTTTELDYMSQGQPVSGDNSSMFLPLTAVYTFGSPGSAAVTCQTTNPVGVSEVKTTAIRIRNLYTQP
jgi:hypothetical protein